MSLLAIENLHMAIHGFPVLKGVTLRVAAGEVLGVIGESGSGKTTLGRILVGLDQPTKGEVLYKGKEIRTYSAKEKKWFHHQTQMIFQNPFASLNPFKKHIINT